MERLLRLPLVPPEILTKHQSGAGDPELAPCTNATSPRRWQAPLSGLRDRFRVPPAPRCHHRLLSGRRRGPLSSGRNVPAPGSPAESSKHRAIFLFRGFWH